MARAVLTNGHTGHVQRAPDFFFFLRDPQLAVVNFFKLIAVHCLCNTKQTYSKGLFFRCAGIVADNGAKNAANFLP